MYSFDQFKQDLKKNFVDKDSSDEVVCIWCKGQFGESYIPTQIFNELYYKYISSKIASKVKTTDKNNNISIKHALNIIYLDGDYSYSDNAITKYIAANTNDDDDTETINEYKEYVCDDITRIIMKQHINYWKDILAKHKVNIVYQFEFIHDKLNDKLKGGHHVFLICDKDISQEDRKTMCNELADIVENDNIESIQDPIDSKTMLTFKDFIQEYTQTFQQYPNEWITKLFDANPIRNANPLLLFGQKEITSNVYKCVNHNFKNVTLDTFVGIHSFDKSKASYKSCLAKFNITLETTDPKERNYIESMIADTENLNRYYEKDEETGEEFFDEDALVKGARSFFHHNEQSYKYEDISYNFGPCVADTLVFVKSLSYLSPNHKLFKVVADHNQRMRNFIRPLVSFIYVNALLRKNRELTQDECNMLCNIVTEYILDIIKCTVHDENDPTQRDTFKSCNQCVSDVFYKFVKNNMNSKYKHVWFEYMKLSPSKRKEIDLAYDSSIIEKHNDDTSTEDNDVYNDGPCMLKKSDVTFATDKIKNYYISWINCVNKLILENITTEIEPFDRTEIKRGMKPVREGYTFENFIRKYSNQPDRTKFYYETISEWIKMMLFITYLNTDSTNGSLGKIVTNFIRYYIWYTPTAEHGNSIYIYNIQQTEQLSVYPYNQWIADNNGMNIRNWIGIFFMKFIQPILERTGKIEINHYLSAARQAGFTIHERDDIKLKSFGNMSKGLSALYDVVISTFKLGDGAPAQPVFKSVTQEPIFPCRNGILYFDEITGDVHFSTDNKNVYTDGFTCIEYDEHYNYSNKFYKRIEQMWDETFPIQSQQVYIRNVLSSIISGKIMKDQFLILYGTGSDGKTLFCNFVQSMLGLNSAPRTASYTDDDGITHNYINPHGLAASMKTNTVLAVQHTGHDEGGTSELEGARFCTIQEPDNNVSDGKLNCSVIKELLSGSSISSRKIYQSSRAFIPNCLIILQTNTIPRYSEDTDAVRRRISLVPMSTKFYTTANEKQYSKYPYKHQADPMFATAIQNDNRYWTALFMSLLPYTKRLYRMNKIPLSNVDKPFSISQTTANSFNNASGLMGWLNQCMIPEEGKCVYLPDLVNTILEVDSQSSRNGDNKKLLEVRSHNISARQFEIVQNIQTKFHTIFRLKQTTEFYRTIVCKAINIDVVKSISANCESNNYQTDAEVIDKYFEPHAVPSTSASNLNGIVKADLFIVGYVLDKTQYHTGDEDEQQPMIDVDDEDDEDTDAKQQREKKRRDKEARELRKLKEDEEELKLATDASPIFQKLKF